MVMGKKAPRKEDLLEAQNQNAKTDQSSGESPDVRKTKEEADIAANLDKKTEHEIKKKLREQGYNSLEEGLADVEKKKQEADKILAYAKEQEQSIAEQLGTIGQEKQKVTNAYAIVKKREETVNARLEEAVKLEQSRQSELGNHQALKDELQQLVEYHRERIKPCRKALLNISVAIYNFADSLTNARIDFTNLYNYIGKVMKVVDDYTEKEDKAVPADILTDEKQPDDEVE